MQNQFQSSVLIEARHWLDLLRLQWGGGHSRAQPRDPVRRKLAFARGQLEVGGRTRVKDEAQGGGGRSFHRPERTPDTDRFDDEAGR